ncbi:MULTISPECIES: type II secretion system F family protein [unclassified Yoonia]|uniref:type II secretion system F family protein n=1 Tax=unclassified Yoonia TaxID=2629118 RepID=UPI002AFF8366|nr:MULTISPECIES: type II secretion system F family protein [unclassified Yoonia]
MPTFTYRAIDQTGAPISGELSAIDRIAALDIIAAKGLAPISISDKASTVPWWNRDLEVFGARQLNPKETEKFFGSLAAMLEAKVPLTRALQFCRDIASDRTMKSTLRTAIIAVEDGQSLSDALSRGPVAFPERLTKVIRLGEVSNTLDQVAARTSTMLKTEARLRSDLRQALVYPIILLAMSVLVMAVLVFYLAPTLAPVFTSANTPPPMIISVMLRIQQTAAAHWSIVLGTLMVILLALFLARFRISAGWQWFLPRVPGLRQFRSKRETLSLLQTMYLILASGGQLTDAIGTAASTVGSPSWKTMLADAKKAIEAGQSMREALLDDPRIDPMARNILQTGEESDQLVAVLEPAIARFEAETSQMMSQLTKMLTPILTLIIGTTVGAIILSTVSAIMDLNDAVL